jgi:hypothetical protein
MVIQKVPGRRVFLLKSKSTGKVLGRFPSREKAVARERQISFFKCVRAGVCRRTR